MATQSGTVTVEDSVLMSYNIKHQSLPYNAAGAFFSIHPKEFKTQVHIKTWMRMFTAALFVTASTEKWPRCPSMDEQTVVHPDSGTLLRA